MNRPLSRSFLARSIVAASFVTVVACLLTASPLAAQFNYCSLGSLDDVALNGAARRLKDRIRLVPARGWQGGAAWFRTKQRVADGFECTFSFQVSEPGSNRPFVPGADGIAFVLQNSSISEGARGGGIGYEGIVNSMAVEFDTYDNNPEGNAEPNGEHVSVQTRGREPNSPLQEFSLGATTAIPSLKAGARHTAKVRYQPGTLQVFVDDLHTPVLTVAVRIDSLLDLDDGRCWMGFTSATGESWANFDLFNLRNEVQLKVSPTPSKRRAGIVGRERHDEQAYATDGIIAMRQSYATTATAGLAEGIRALAP